LNFLPSEFINHKCRRIFLVVIMHPYHISTKAFLGLNLFLLIYNVHYLLEAHTQGPHTPHIMVVHQGMGHTSSLLLVIYSSINKCKYHMQPGCIYSICVMCVLSSRLFWESNFPHVYSAYKLHKPLSFFLSWCRHTLSKRNMSNGMNF